MISLISYSIQARIASGHASMVVTYWNLIGITFILHSPLKIFSYDSDIPIFFDGGSGNVFKRFYCTVPHASLIDQAPSNVLFRHLIEKILLNRLLKIYSDKIYFDMNIFHDKYIPTSCWKYIPASSCREFSFSLRRFSTTLVINGLMEFYNISWCIPQFKFLLINNNLITWSPKIPAHTLFFSGYWAALFSRVVDNCKV